MSTDLPTTFQLSQDPNSWLASVEASARLHAFALSPGQALVFGPDARFNLAELTLIFSFEPAWVPWTDDDSPASAPCVVALGTRDDSGTVFRVTVTRALDALLVDSSETTAPIRLEGDFSKGAQIVLCLGPFTASLSTRGGPVTTGVHFALGTLADGALACLTFGSDADPALSAPFAGIISRVMLFDKNLSSQSHDQSQAAHSWRKGRWDSFYEALSLASEAPFVSALVGVARSDQGEGATPGFDFIPRDILRPDPSQRWVLASSTHPPVRLAVPGRPEHGIYSTFNLFCFTINDGKPCLWGDGGQCFALTYAGKGLIRAVQAVASRPDVLHATLQRNGSGSFELVPEGWSNTTAKVFATKTFRSDMSVEGADPSDLWPERIQLLQVPSSYDNTRGNAKPVHQDQPFKGAFSKRLPQIGMSARGFDPSRLSAFNPGASDGAQASEEFYVFRQPADDSTLYRVDFIATPYYLFSSAPGVKTSGGATIAYKNAAEAMNSESTSLGLDVGVGDTTLFSIAEKTNESQQSSGSSENVLALRRSRELKYLLSLDRRWVELNPNLVDCALREADRHLSGDTHPPPFRQLFVDFGTHYANAITYGCQSGEVEMLDVTTIGSLVQSGSSIEAKLKIPVEGGTVGVRGGHETEQKQGGEQSQRKESRSTIEVGSDADPMPIFLDLRPLWELLQPPYINDERMRRTFEFAAQAWNNLQHERTHPPPLWETPLLVQVRLRSITNNLGATPCYLRARTFIVGVAEGSTWTIVAPSEGHREHAVPIWMSNGVVRIDGDFSPGVMPVITLAIPRRGVKPAIGFTGHLCFTYPDKIADEITEHNPWEAPPARISRGLGAGAAPHRQPASAAQIREVEDRYGNNLPSVSASGTDWTDLDAQGQPLAQDASDPPSLYAATCQQHVIREKLYLNGVDEGPEFSTQSITLLKGAVWVNVEVRIVDPMNLLDDDSAAGYRYA